MSEVISENLSLYCVPLYLHSKRRTYEALKHVSWLGGAGGYRVYKPGNTANIGDRAILTGRRLNISLVSLRGGLMTSKMFVTLI